MKISLENIHKYQRVENEKHQNRGVGHHYILTVFFNSKGEIQKTWFC